MTNIHYCRFAVDEQPYCVWEWDLDQRNADFVDRLDPSYFEYLAAVHSGEQADEKSEQYAAQSLRLGYSHGLEAFFSLLFAVVQAPSCVGGWLLRYQLSQLRSLVRKVSRGRKFLSRVELPQPTWEGLATVVHPGTAPPEVSVDFRQSFGRLWSEFARNFLDEDRTLEYNSFKHGLRVSPGGFYVASALEAQPGVTPPPEEFRSMGGSRFGSTFFKPQDLAKKGRHFRTRWRSVNWVPENLAHGLTLLSVSMHNVIAFQKLVTGEAKPQNLIYRYPKDPRFFDLPWRLSPGVTAIDMDDQVLSDHIHEFTKEEILKVYDGEEE